MKIKLTIKTVAIFLGMAFAASSLIFPAHADMLNSPYTSYTYSSVGKVMHAPPAYLSGKIIDPARTKSGRLINPSDMYIRDGNIYIADSGNNRIVVFSQDWQFVQEFKVFYNVKSYSMDGMKNPQGVFADKNGQVYVADTDNNRVLIFDNTGMMLYALPKPVTDFIEKSLDYFPEKTAVDNQGRIYIVARNVNQGIIQVDTDGVFKGFIGAAKVEVNAYQLFWRLFSTREQRSRMTLFAPSEYNNICLDGDNFIYCTTSSINKGDLLNSINSRSKDDRFAPVRRINPSGSDVLKRNGFFPPAGDLDASSAFIDVTVRSNGIYSVLDSSKGRIFTYDNDGNLLYVFGGLGSRSGNTEAPVSICSMGDNIYVLDKNTGLITQYVPTVYGELINRATTEQYFGRYAEAYDIWESVLALNSNCELAYLGMGKVDLRQKNYEAAMINFKNCGNRDLYSKALKKVRARWIEQHFAYIGTGILLFIAAAFAIVFKSKLKMLIKLLRMRLRV